MREEVIKKVKFDAGEFWCDNKGSYYIGEGESYVIERNQGSRERGWQPYC